MRNYHLIFARSFFFTQIENAYKKQLFTCIISALDLHNQRKYGILYKIMHFMNTYTPSIRPEDEIDPFAVKILPGELVFYDTTKENWGFFSGRSSLRLALTTHAVIYESPKKNLRIPLEEVYYTSGNKNSPAHVS